jgi:spermidine synthase
MFGTKILEERKSKFNGELKVVRTLGFGTHIQAEGLTQSGGLVESIWKSTLKRIVNCKLKIKNCLILGLGGGTVAKLIRKNWSEARITGVDIDSVMIELGKKYLNLNEYKVDILIADASNLSNLSNLPNWPNSKFDLIIVDLYQGDKYPEKFETENYIQLVRSNLTRSGIVVFNRLYYGDKRPQAVKFGNRLKKIFSKVSWFYPEANLMFLCSV